MERLSLDTKLMFGKHKGKTISEICELEPTYIEWCILNIPDFYLYSDDVTLELKKYHHTPTTELLNILKTKDDKYYSKVIENGTRSMEIWGEMMHLTGWSWQTHLPKPKNDKQAYREKIELLQNNWDTISLDKQFIENTLPKVFTGKKGRRLVIKKLKDFPAPWGSWFDHLKNGKPSKFTELRKRINDLIKPLEIDHIDFID